MSVLIELGSVPIEVFEDILGDDYNKYDKVAVAKIIAADFMSAIESQIWDFAQDDFWTLEREGDLDEYLIEDGG